MQYGYRYKRKFVAIVPLLRLEESSPKQHLCRQTIEFCRKVFKEFAPIKMFVFEKFLKTTIFYITLTAQNSYQFFVAKNKVEKINMRALNIDINRKKNVASLLNKRCFLSNTKYFGDLSRKQNARG